ncbi:MAG: tRNA (adenosine(37)-N6)-threonylcarbamoyltransferase complex dimerization subunit type 1 TsaB [Bacteroidales bacterium]|nr:tRNA (adenosine(37)-N6)-threonylcarbamoyltransferase complex dimerization subunit type 1 TsaB [Bacteroidales bacterium]
MKSINTLLLETATSVCSVVLGRDGKIVKEIHSDDPNAHSSRLSPFIEQLMKECDMELRQLDAVCVSSGPGSYTGLRIGVSTAKGICYALSIPLLSVPTLQNMATQYYVQHPDYQGMVCPMIDARRMECYTAIYASPTLALKEVSADIITPDIYDEYLNRGLVTFLGDGAEKTRALLGRHPNARYASDFRISATGMLPIAMQRLQDGQKEDVAYFEPFYLKDFVAKKSTVRGLKEVRTES